MRVVTALNAIAFRLPPQATQVCVDMRRSARRLVDIAANKERACVRCQTRLFRLADVRK